MNGFAGLRKPRKQKQEAIKLKEHALNLWKECVGLVAGLDVGTGRNNAPSQIDLILSSHNLCV